MTLKLYESPLKATRTGSLYNAFSYPTKISPEAIALFIATHTNPGSRVVDTFGGSGTTGLATLLCDKPTEAMLKMTEELDLKPIWGPREAYIFDVSVLASFVAKTLCNPPEPHAFLHAANSLLEKASEELAWMYEAIDLNGEKGFIRHIIWSDIIQCSLCNTELVFHDVCVDVEPVSFLTQFTCPQCSEVNEVKRCRKAVEVKKDKFTGELVESRKRVPVKLYGQTDKVKWKRDINKDDIDLIEKIYSLPFNSSMPHKKIVWGDLYRSGYHKGITHLHHFYTTRNYHVISTLWNLVEEFPEAIRDSLRLLILSYNSTHSTIMTRVVAKKNQKDFVLTGAQSGVMYVSSLPVEKNILEGIKRKISGFESAFKLVEGSSSKVFVENRSSEKLPLESGSVDYVFTDPPFGDYIPYAEINQINELWLETVTNRSEEIIVSKASGKNIERYSEMMFTVFSEISRVLKDEGKSTVVFHSAKSSIWQALAKAYSRAGLSVVVTSVLDKIQSSFKQSNSNISVKGDPLILLVKGKACNTKSESSKWAMDTIFNSLKSISASEKTPERLYARYINLCLEKEIKIDVDASEFYVEAKKRLLD